MLNHGLPTSDVDLGRLVVTMKNPAQEYCECKSVPMESSPPDRLESFSEVLGRAKGSRLHGLLLSVLSGGTAGLTASSSEVRAASCITRTMRQCDDYFRRLCAAPRARDFIERAFGRGKKVFLVVGVKTVTDATVTQSELRARVTSTGLCSPSVLSPLLGGGPVEPIGAGASAWHLLVGGAGFFAPGEHVYAVQYRRVHVGVFSRRSVDESWLEKENHWKRYFGMRGAGEPEENDGIEARLADADEVEGSEEGADMESCETVEGDGEKTVYIWG